MLMQLDPDGLIEVLNGEGIVFVSWLGTSSLWSRAGPMGLKSETLGIVSAVCLAYMWLCLGVACGLAYLIPRLS